MRPGRCPVLPRALPSSSRMTRAQPSPPTDLDMWLDGCQRLAMLPAGTVGPAYTAIGRVVATIPGGLSAEQRAAARKQIDEAWQRLLSAALSPGPSAVATEATPSCQLSAVADGRVMRALHEIERRYADPQVRLGQVARQLAVSPTHLTQLLKLSSGRTFGAHLHQRRIAAACRLLVETTLSVKEIATRVGYASTTQLDRHFRKLVRRSPSAYRIDERTPGSTPGAAIRRATAVLAGRRQSVDRPHKR